MTSQLRKRAEAHLRKSLDEAPVLPSLAMQELIHELHVHQAELEMQNEELLRTQQELIDVRDRHIGLYQSIPVGCLAIDNRRTIQTANEAALTMLCGRGKEKGRTPVGRRLDAYVAPVDADACYLHLRRVAEARAAQRADIRFRRSDGTLFWVDMETVPVPGTRAADEFQVTLNDITARKQAEERLSILNSQLMQREEQLSLFVEHAPAAIAMFDGEMRYMVASLRWLSDYGLRGQELTGRCHYEVFPEISEHRKTIHRRCLAGAVERQDEDLFVRADGTRQWLRWEILPWHSGPGKIGGIIIFSEDITDRKLAELSLQESLLKSECKYRELVENANSIIMRISPDFKITFFNEYAQEFFGYEDDEVLGQCAIGTITPEADSEGRDMRAVMREIAMTPESQASHECESRCKDGRKTWVHWSNRAVRDDQGNVMEILCVGTDITRRCELEREARIHHERLRALADRLAIAEEQNRWRISRYIHDAVVQNLSLACIRLAALEKSLKLPSMNGKSSDLKPIRALLGDVISECRLVMSDLTPALLYELGLVPALQELLQDLGKKHGVRMGIVDNAPDMPDLAHSLRGLLFQASRELIMNALKHAEASGIRVTVNCENGLVMIGITDNGAGFDMDAVAARRGTGSGFGLFSIRQRVEGLGGCLDIVSAPGHGTAATIIVPLESSPTDAARSSRSCTSRSATCVK